MTTTFRIYYMRPAWFRDGLLGRHPDPKNLGATHVFVRSVEAGSVEHTFVLCQGEVWSPNGEARGLIERLGLHHTSMSVGDVAVDPTGRIWVCASQGFIDLTDGNAEEGVPT